MSRETDVSVVLGNQSGGSFMRVMQRHAALVNCVKGIYRMQFGREFRVPRIALDRGVISWGRTSWISLPEFYMTPERLVQMESLIAHLTTGKRLDFDALGLGVQRADGRMIRP